MNRNNLSLITVGMACWLLAGCGSARYTVIQPPTQDFNSFNKTVEVKEFTSQVFVSEDLTREMLPSISKKLEDALKDKHYTITKAGERLVIEGNIVELEPGSRFLRWFIGFGAGRGRILVNLDLKDAAGNVVAKGSAEGTVVGGGGGGGIDDAVDRMTDEIADYVIHVQRSGTPGTQPRTAQASPTPVIAKIDPPSTPPSSARQTPMVVVKSAPSGFLSVWEKTTITSTEIGRVYLGDEIVLMDELENWDKVQLRNGVEGYILKLYVDKKNP